MTEQDLISLIEEVLEERKKKRKKSKKKKKSSGKKDACYHKVKGRYKTWPSAYGSGALVKCRKVGAKNWGNSTNEELTLVEEEGSDLFSVTPSHNVESIADKGLDPSYGSQNYSHGGYQSHSKNKVFLTSRAGLSYWHDKISNMLVDKYDDPKESFPVILKVNVEKAQLKKDELGEKDSRAPAFSYEGAIGPDKLSWWDGERWRQMAEWDFEEAKENENLVNVDYDDEGEIEWSEFPFPDILSEDETLEEKKRKLTKKPSSETSLRDWFARSGEPGKKGGWVDCNAPIRKDGKITGYKSCGRQEGEKRSKYPACRPTKAACKSKGKGTSWGRKASKKNETTEHLEALVLEEVMRLLEEAKRENQE